jgi:general secretion pathway protein D
VTQTSLRLLAVSLCALVASPALAQRRPTVPTQPGQQPGQIQPQPQRPGPQAAPQTAPPGPGGTTVQPGGGAGAGANANADKARASCEQVRAKAKFNVYFDKVEIEKLVQTVSDATCKTFILPENVRGKISIIGPEAGKVEVNADQFYRAFLAALDANGLAVYEQGQFVKVVDKRNAKQTPIPTITDGQPYTSAEQMVTKIFKIKYVEIEPLRGVLQQLVSQNGDTVPFPPDTIIINDLGSNMHRLERIIDQLDSRTASEEMRVIQINFANAQEIADKIQRLFQPTQGAGQRPGGRPARGGVAAAAAPPPPPGGLSAVEGTPGPGGEETTGAVTVSQILPDERTNKLIVIASAGGFARIEELVRTLDVPIPGEGRINVYYLANADAEEMASTLQSLAQGAPAQRGGRPGAAPSVPGQPRPPGAPAQSAELFGGEVKISADKATNSLVIIASQADYRNLIRVIERLDMPRRQVFVEAVIMEVNVDRNLRHGARVHGGTTVPDPTGQGGRLPLLLGTKFGSEALPPSFSVVNLAQFGGFLAGLQGPFIPGVKEILGVDIPAFGVVLHALQESSDVNVLSTPHILTTDNEEAEITVGQNVPFQAGVSPNALSSLAGQAGGAAGGLNPALAGGLFGSLVTPINRQNVELRLTVKPQINESDFIRMVITEQIEEIASTDPVLGPTTSRRTAKTTVVAKDQETIVIGGIMQDRTIEGVNKVPILGDIPVLGHLFREQSRRKVKTNLLLFLTPYIIKDQSDFRRIFERKMAERQQFVETFYGQVPGFEVAIDFDRKPGPLAQIGQSMRRELQKVENGGAGRPGERLILPGGGGAPTEVPPAGAPVEIPGADGEQPGGDFESPPEGSELQ